MMLVSKYFRFNACKISLFELSGQKALQELFLYVFS